jgi:hypothetical protein
MVPIGNGAHTLNFVGRARLALSRVVTLSEGGQYGLAGEVLHSTATPETCVSIVFQGAPKRSENCVFRKSGPAVNLDNSELQYMNDTNLSLSLEEVMNACED